MNNRTATGITIVVILRMHMQQEAPFYTCKHTWTALLVIVIAELIRIQLYG